MLCLFLHYPTYHNLFLNSVNVAPEPPPSKPHFTSRLEPELDLETGQPLILKCKVGGYPPPKTLWYKDGNPLKNEPPYEITSKGGEAMLQIPETMEEDGGVYSCLATNPSGQDATSCNVTVAGLLHLEEVCFEI